MDNTVMLEYDERHATFIKIEFYFLQHCKIKLFSAPTLFSKLNNTIIPIFTSIDLGERSFLEGAPFILNYCEFHVILFW